MKEIPNPSDVFEASDILLGRGGQTTAEKRAWTAVADKRLAAIQARWTVPSATKKDDVRESHARP